MWSSKGLCFAFSITQPLSIAQPIQQVKVLSGAVTEFATLAHNLRVTNDLDKASPGGINGKMLEFLNQSDDAELQAKTVALAERVQSGDSSALRELQQSFMDFKYGGLKLEALMDDDFVKASRSALLNDEVRGLVE